MQMHTSSLPNLDIAWLVTRACWEKKKLRYIYSPWVKESEELYCPLENSPKQTASQTTQALHQGLSSSSFTEMPTLLKTLQRLASSSNTSPFLPPHIKVNLFVCVMGICRVAMGAL